MSDFQIRLKGLREERGMSQQAFADAFGVVQSTVGNWEAGKREPNFETAKKLAKFFKVTVGYLIGAEEAVNMYTSSTGVLLNALCVVYQINADILAVIVGERSSTVKKWILNEAVPSEEQYASISKCFDISIEDLKSGRLPIAKQLSVEKRLNDLKILRYPTLSNHSKYKDYDIDDLDEEAMKIAAAFYGAKLENKTDILDMVRFALSKRMVHPTPDSTSEDLELARQITQDKRAKEKLSASNGDAGKERKNA